LRRSSGGSKRSLGSERVASSALSCPDYNLI
jgi:hypothetical protein